MNNVISNILRFLIMLIVQIVICQHVCLFGYMTPALYLLALFLLPLELPLSLQYLIGRAHVRRFHVCLHPDDVCSPFHCPIPQRCEYQ